MCALLCLSIPIQLNIIQLFASLLCSVPFYSMLSILSYPILSYPILFYPILPYHINITSHASHHITSHHITSHHITSHHITSHHIISYHIISYGILYPVLSILSYPILSYPLSYPELHPLLSYPILPRSNLTCSTLPCSTTTTTNNLFSPRKIIFISTRHIVVCTASYITVPAVPYFILFKFSFPNLTFRSGRVDPPRINSVNKTIISVEVMRTCLFSSSNGR